jgi:4-hydroxy-3-methylbut-2-enyl diphosphate reductase
MTADLLVLAPLSIEAVALRGAPGLRVERAGMGKDRAERTARRLADDPASRVVVAGLAGALDPRLEPGMVVLADSVRDADGSPKARCHGTAALAAELRAAGLDVVVGPIISVDHLVRGVERELLADTGAIAVDMESAWLAPLARGRHFSVARVVIDTPRRELLRPFKTVPGAIVALRSLARVGRALSQWSPDTRIAANPV